MLKFVHTKSRKMSGNENNNKITKAPYELTADEVNFIRSNTELTSEQIEEWWAEFKSKCETGRLNRQEFIHFFKGLIHFDYSEQDELAFCEHVFRAFDTDNDGCVDFAEFLIAFWVRCNGTLRDKLTWLFEIYDTDRSSFISVWEMAKLLKIVYGFKNIVGDPTVRAREIFAQIDRNKDGKLSRSEFIAGCTQDEKLRKLLAPF
jgi:Ca2+-binding EF-hand superfamily protein